jgi:hypothetical protein
MIIIDLQRQRPRDYWRPAPQVRCSGRSQHGALPGQLLAGRKSSNQEDLDPKTEQPSALVHFQDERELQWRSA